MEQSVRNTQEAMDKTAQTMSETIVEVLDKLAGKKSEIKLSFQDLSFETGVVKAKMTGAIRFETTMAKETEISGSYANKPTKVYDVS
jgi:hypothetical protein